MTMQLPPMAAIPEPTLNPNTLTHDPQTATDAQRYQFIQRQLDEIAVDAIASQMKKKLALKRSQGYGGWETCSIDEIFILLKAQTQKPQLDPVDIAIFSAFINMKIIASKKD